MAFSADGTELYVTESRVLLDGIETSSGEDGLLVFKRDPVSGFISEASQKLTKRNSFGTSVSAGNEVVARPFIDSVANGSHIVLDEPLAGKVTENGIFQFYAGRFGQITPLLLQPIGDDDHTNPSSLGWNIVATGRPRNIEQFGINEFEFDLQTGSVGDGTGFYFGWIESGNAAGETAVVYSQNTASGAFQFNPTATTNSYRAGRAYSMDARFETEAVLGLDRPRSIAVSGNGTTLYTGDSAGNIATWVRPNGGGKFALATQQDWYLEPTLSPNLSAANIGRGVNVEYTTDRKLQVLATANAPSENAVAAITSVEGLVLQTNTQSSQSGAAADPLTNPTTGRIETQNFAGFPVSVYAGHSQRKDAIISGSGVSAFRQQLDIDLAGASIATNGEYVLVGAPASDRVVSPSRAAPDDAGAVLVYRISGNGSPVEQEQALLPTFNASDLSYTEFGTNIAMQGNVALISYRQAGSWNIQIWDLVGGLWTRRQQEIAAGSSPNIVLDMDRDIAIVGLVDGTNVFNSGVSLYRISTGALITSLPVSQPIGVGIDGDTATVVESDGTLRIFRELTTGWTNMTAVDSTATKSTQTLTELSGPPTVTFSLKVLMGVKHDSGEGGDSEWQVSAPGGGTCSSEAIFNPGTSVNNLNSYADGFINHPAPANSTRAEGKLDFEVWEIDNCGRPSDNEYVGRFSIYDGSPGFQDPGALPNAIWKGTPASGNHARTLNNGNNGAVNIYGTVIYGYETDTKDVVTDIVDSLGDVVAIGVPASNTVEVFAESHKQKSAFSSGGAITDLVVSPDGTTVYATDLSGRVVVLKENTINARDSSSLNLNAAQTFVAPDVSMLGGASSLTLTEDGSSLFVTAAESGAAMAFARGAIDNLLSTRTILQPNSATDLQGAADAAIQATADTSLSYAVIANSVSSSLATFRVQQNTGGNPIIVADQGPNPNGLNGLADGDPLGGAERVQSLTLNPCGVSLSGIADGGCGGGVETFYVVSPTEDSLFVIERTSTSVLTRGLGHTTANGVPVTDGEGTGMTLNIFTNATGQIVRAAVSNPGTGYKPGDLVTVPHPTNPANNALIAIFPSQRVTQVLQDDIKGVSPEKDDGLKGASAIAVSPDGKFVFVAATNEGDNGQVSVFQRQPVTIADGSTADGLVMARTAANTLLAPAITSVFQNNNPTVGDPLPNEIVTIRTIEDKVYVAGVNGLQVFRLQLDAQQNPISLDLLQTYTGPEFLNLSDIKFAQSNGPGLVYAVQAEVDGSGDQGRLVVLDRSADGSLANPRTIDSRMDNPRSVEIGPALDGPSPIPVGRFVYVASADNNSISVFDEFSADGSDTSINGNLRHVQIVREGVNGVRGLQGVHVLLMSAEVFDSTLTFIAEQLDVSDGTINVEGHGLNSGQQVFFQTAADAPGGVVVDGTVEYFVRKIDGNRFELFNGTGPTATKVALSAGDGSYALQTSIPAGAFVYALSKQSNAITVFKRDLEPQSPTLGQLTFMQIIQNRVGNRTSGANDGLFRPDAIVTPVNDQSTVYVGSAFDPVGGTPYGGFVSLHNNADDSPALPPVETKFAFSNIQSLAIKTGGGSDVVTVNQAPTDGLAGGAVIPIDVNTGDGMDSFTLNDAGDQVLTSADLGSGDDSFTLRTQREAAGGNVQVRTGDGADAILTEEVAINSTVMIWTEAVTGDPDSTWTDNVRVAATGIHQNANVTIETGNGGEDFLSYEVELAAITEGNQIINGNNANGNQLQLNWNDANTPYGSVFAKVGSNNELPNNEFAFAGLTPVASVVDPGAITQGSSVTFESNSDLPIVAQSAETTVTTTYAWDINNDGLFTEFVTEEPATTFAWEDLVDFGFAAQGGGQYRVPLRVTRTIKTFNPELNPKPQIQVQQSDSEVTVTVNDTAPVAVVNAGQPEAAHVVRLGGAPFSIDLATGGNDPTGDEIVSWMVTWADGETAETFDADTVATHFYSRPGRYEVTVTGVDNNGQQTQPVTTNVDVTFDSAAVTAGGAYAINEGDGVVLQGIAAGLPDSFSWMVNGNDAGAGTSLPFDPQTQSVTNRITLTWAELQALGVDNEGGFNVQLGATYDTATIASANTTLTIANVAPTAVFFGSGPIDQGGSATVGFTEVVEPNDTLVYSYNFGDGFVVGDATFALPSTLAPGNRTITGRISDGTATQDFETTLVISDLPPSVSVDGGLPNLIEVNEGDTTSLTGSYENPGGGAVTVATSIGSITSDPANKTFTWTYSPADNTVGVTPGTITITDAEGSQAQLNLNVLVSNLAPQAVFAVPNDVLEGATGVTVSLTDLTDASATDLAAGLRFSFDFGDDGSFEIGDGSYAGGVTSASATVPAALLADDGDIPIRVYVLDKDGGRSELVESLSIANVAATLGPLTVTPQQISGSSPVTITGTFAGDPSTLDTQTIQVDWGDGQVDRLSAENQLGISHPGTGYADAVAVAVTGGSGTGMTVNLATENGQIIEALINAAGSGYQVGDVLTVSGGGGNGRLTLGGFNATTGTFTAVHAYQFDTQSLPNPIPITVRVSDDEGGQDSQSTSIEIAVAPSITSNAVVTVDEQQTLALDVQSTDPTDSEGDGLTYRISGGSDQSQFNIEPSTGVVTFTTAPVFDSPTDVNQDNTYELQVTVTDRTGLTDVKDFAISVVAVESNVPPTIVSSSTFFVLENQIAVVDLESFDSNGETEGDGLTYRISGGADQSRFAIAAATGILTFVAAPDFENPTDADTDNVYEVQVAVTDSGQLSGSSDLSITVQDVVEGSDVLDFGDAPDSASSPSYPTLEANNGARHVIGSLFLGAGVDADGDGQPSDMADADADDGIRFLTSLVAGASATRSSVSVTASMSGRLDAWIDFNRDGDWDDIGEQIIDSEDLAGGENTLGFVVPASAADGTTFARFRLSSAGGLSPQGLAGDGEVEDYAVNLLPSGNAEVSVRAFDPGTITFESINGDAVVRQDELILFQSPLASLTSVDMTGSDGNDTFVVSAEIAGSDLSYHINGGNGFDALRLLGENHLLDLDDGNVPKATSLEQIDIRGSGSNRLKLSETSILAMLDGGSTLRVFKERDDMVEIVGDDADITGTRIDASQFVVEARTTNTTIELIGQEWTNPLDHLDVDDSDRISALDALLIINQLNSSGYTVPGTRQLINPVDLTVPFPMRFFDTSGNGRLSALDALLIINHLNSVDINGELVEAVAPQRQAERQTHHDMRTLDNVDSVFTEVRKSVGRAFGEVPSDIIGDSVEWTDPIGQVSEHSRQPDEHLATDLSMLQTDQWHRPL